MAAFEPTQESYWMNLRWNFQYPNGGGPAAQVNSVKVKLVFGALKGAYSIGGGFIQYRNPCPCQVTAFNNISMPWTSVGISPDSSNSVIIPSDVSPIISNTDPSVFGEKTITYTIPDTGLHGINEINDQRLNSLEGIWRFRFAVGTGSTFDGTPRLKTKVLLFRAELEIEYVDKAGRVQDVTVKAGTGTNGQSNLSENKANTEDWAFRRRNDQAFAELLGGQGVLQNGGANNYNIYGGPTDKWGYTREELNDYINDLKVSLSAKGLSNANTSIAVPYVYSKVYYHTLDTKQYVTEKLVFNKEVWTYNDITGSDVNVKLKLETPVTNTSLDNNRLNIHKVEVQPFYTYGIEVPGPPWPTEETEQIYGSATNTWGLPLTNRQINSPDFSVKFKNTYTSSLENGITGSISDIQMKVFYKTVSSTDVSIQDYLPRGVEDHRYNGSKMTSADFNEPSTDTIDGGPVVELTKNINFTDE